MDDRVTPPPVAEKKADLNKFVDDLFTDAQELRAVLKDEGDNNGIKDRITCLKYLEEILKTYVILKKAATDDPAAAGSTVRKYATAFSKNATGSGKKAARRRADIDRSDSDDEGDDYTAA